MFDKSFAEMVALSRRENAKAEGDYVGEDGFLYCGECHTRKETSVMIKGKDGEDIEFRPYVPCKCRKEKIDALATEEAEKKQAELVTRLRANSCIPDLYAEATFDSFRTRGDNGNILHMIRRYVDKFDQMFEKAAGLLFHGTVGTGKTYAAACVGNELIAKGRSVYMTSTCTMLKLRDDDAEDYYLNRIVRPSILIVDDIGAERSTDFGRERVFGYIDARMNAKKPMVITTNLPFERMLKPETVEESRIYDRMLKRCFPVVFAGETWRRTEAKENFNEMKSILEGDDD